MLKTRGQAGVWKCKGVETGDAIKMDIVYCKGGNRGLNVRCDGRHINVREQKVLNSRFI